MASGKCEAGTAASRAYGRCLRNEAEIINTMLGVHVTSVAVAPFLGKGLPVEGATVLSGVALP